MEQTLDLEKTLLATLRQLSPEKQQIVLNFAKSLKQESDLPKTSTTSDRSIPSLREIAKLPLAERHKILEPMMQETAEDFASDPELSIFCVLDGDSDRSS
ncbi:MAG: hypothetical protein AAGA60_11290 [Cyanobacteria bacterium P01_E01_bin.42]